MAAFGGGNMIRYADIIRESVVDGPGIRVVAFLQGCPRHCYGCHNENLISLEGGEFVTEEEFANIILSQLSPIHRGITFSGGDPIIQSDQLEQVISIIKAKRPNIDIWVYTGYVYEEISRLSIMKQIDVLVDGPFEMDKRNVWLAFRGSQNQRIIDVQESRVLGKVVEVDFDGLSAISSIA